MESCNLCGTSWQYWHHRYANLDCCPDWICNDCYYQMVYDCVDSRKIVKCRCGAPIHVEEVERMLSNDSYRMKNFEKFLEHQEYCGCIDSDCDYYISDESDCKSDESEEYDSDDDIFYHKYRSVDTW